MTTEAIIESGMTFGPFAAGECFYVEKSKCYGLIQDGVQMAEFLLLRQKQDHAPVIWVVEAKSSSPSRLLKYSRASEPAQRRQAHFSQQLSVCWKSARKPACFQPYSTVF